MQILWKDFYIGTSSCKRSVSQSMSHVVAYMLVHLEAATKSYFTEIGIPQKAVLYFTFSRPVDKILENYL